MLAIVADDLSGSMNIGVEFTTAGLEVTVATDDKPVDVKDVLIIDSETRNATSNIAYQRVYDIGVNLRDKTPEIVIKKIDSLLRGSIGQEIEALKAGCQLGPCLLIAASPTLGRKTLNGNHFIDGQLLEMVRHQVDPNSAVEGSNIPAILREQTRLSIDCIDIDLIRQGDAALQQSIQQSSEMLLVADCTSQDNLNTVVAAAYKAGIRFFAGTYGLGTAIAQLLVPPRLPILVVVGSLSIVAHYQVQYLMKNADCGRIEIDYDGGFLENSIEDFAQPYREQLRQAASEHDCVILQLGALAGEVQRLWQTAEMLGMDRTVVSRRIDDLLRAVMLDNLTLFSGFVATGGTTAYSLYNLMNADGLRLEAVEILPGTPGATIVGGPFDGRPFIAKPGSQGQDDALHQMVQYMRGKR